MNTNTHAHPHHPHHHHHAHDDPHDPHDPHDDALDHEGVAGDVNARVYRNPGDRPVMVTRAVSEYVSRPIAWLEPERIALGKLTLLAGDPGLGKSFLTLDLAARVSRGELPVGDAQRPASPGRALILSAEDDPADTIRPRLEAMDADLRRVLVLEGVVRPMGRVAHAPRLDDDLALLAQTARRVKDLRLIVIDPISAYLGKTDSNNNAEVRGVLGELAAIAARSGAAVVCVTHLNKDQGGQKKAIYRAMGSLAFAAAARTVFAVSKHPDNPDKRVVSMVKNNVGVGGSSRVYRIDQGRVAWLDEACSLDADTIEGGSESVDQVTALEEAERFLAELLRNGPVAAAEVFFEAASVGISEITLRRARRRIGVHVERADKQWAWRLPQVPGSGDEVKMIIPTPKG